MNGSNGTRLVRISSPVISSVLKPPSYGVAYPVTKVRPLRSGPRAGFKASKNAITLNIGIDTARLVLLTGVSVQERLWKRSVRLLVSITLKIPSIWTKRLLLEASSG